MSETTQAVKTGGQKIKDGAKSNAEPIGISAAVVIAWAMTQWADVTMPAEVIAAVGGLIGAVSARIKS